MRRVASSRCGAIVLQLTVLAGDRERVSPLVLAHVPAGVPELTPALGAGPVGEQAVGRGVEVTALAGELLLCCTRAVDRVHGGIVAGVGEDVQGTMRAKRIFGVFSCGILPWRRWNRP